jgi:hypothetical protein
MPVLVGWALGLLAPFAAADAPARLVHAEPLAGAWETADAPGPVAAGTAPGRNTLRFQAFGRDFALELARADRLAPPADRFRLLAGRINGLPRSWARLTRHGDELVGVVFDGAEYYGIEPARGLAEFLDPALVLPPQGNAIYRLTDLLLDPAALGCELAVPEGAAASAADVLDLIGAELHARAAAALTPARQVRLAPVADYEFAGRYGANAESEVMARLNVVDGIFGAQVGIEIAAGAPTVFRSTAPPYPFGESASGGLLGQLSDYRLVHHEDFGLTHLFTGKTLGSGLVGIAWLGAVCFEREGAALSTSAGLTRVLSALVAAHEIGHNFGAPHDGEPGSACAATPTTFLMAARSSGSSSFSACSRERMTAVIEAMASLRPACLAPLPEHDLAVVAPERVSARPGTTVQALVIVRNVGTAAASGVTLLLSAGAGLVISGVSHDHGFCDYGEAELACDLAQLAAGASWPMTVELAVGQPGSFPVSATVSAASDRDPDNDSASMAVVVAAGSAGSGGGGSTSLLTLAALALALARRLTRRKPGLSVERKCAGVAADV